MSLSVEIGDHVFGENQIKLDSSNTINTSKSLSFELFSLDVITLIIKCDDTRLLSQKGKSFKMIMNGQKSWIYFVNSISRIGVNFYKVVATTPAYRLASMPHPGGIYTGQRAEDVILDICGDVPVIVKTVLASIPVYGWLPYCNPPERSARDNLSQVLFCLGASLGTDLDGVLRVEPLWDGISNIADDDRMYQGGSVVYDSPVSAVAVTEHQYIPGGEEETLFEGTAEAGHLVIFNAPHSSLVADGFKVQSSGANWARLSAGSGTLTGKAYIHTTRLLTVPVKSGAPENVKSVTDCTLISLVSSRAAANRLAEYYRCTERIQAPILTTTHKAGQRLSIYNPYDKVMTNGVIASMDVTLSGVLKGDSDVLVGYVPPQPEDVEYFDHREVITKSGTWTAPDGVSEGVAVLIGGGQGGFSGWKGGETESVKNISYTSGGIGKYNYRGYFASQGGAGGEAGEGGSGGRILVVNFTVPTSRSMRVVIGTGGAGGIFTPDGTQAGAQGTATIFGSYTSANGSPNVRGYTDTVTGEVFAKSGPSGVAGGSGSGGPTETPSHWTIEPEELFTEGTEVIGPDGRIWTPDRLPIKNDENDWSGVEAISTDYNNLLAIRGCFGLSGGAAVGANGANGTHPTGLRVTKSDPMTGRGTAGVGGKGADAVAPAKELGNRGNGGRGGHGGGGAGGSGQINSITQGSVGTITLTGQMQSAGPGNGSNGAPGGDGVLILYYRSVKPMGSGQLTTKGKKFMFDRLGRIFVV